MHPSKKITKQLTVKGGCVCVCVINPYGQPDRKISRFLLTISLTDISILILTMIPILIMVLILTQTLQSSALPILMPFLSCRPTATLIATTTLTLIIR